MSFESCALSLPESVFISISCLFLVFLCHPHSLLLPQDREFVELDVPFNGQTTKTEEGGGIGVGLPIASPEVVVRSALETAGWIVSCCGKCGRKKYEVSQLIICHSSI